MIRTGNDRQAGFTLMELTVVITLAGVVTLGLVAFYLNSQMLWMDASTQALAQRDATGIMEAMREQAETSSFADIQLAGGGPNKVLVLLDKDSNETCRFFWSPSDSLIHFGVGSAPADDRGPVAPTKVERFAVSLDPLLPLVNIDTLRVRTTTGQTVQLSGGLGLYNAP